MHGVETVGQSGGGCEPRFHLETKWGGIFTPIPSSDLVNRALEAVEMEPSMLDEYVDIFDIPEPATQTRSALTLHQLVFARSTHPSRGQS